MDVSIIIVNYNTCRLTADCIDSVFEKTRGIDFEVIVVDNASSDESPRILSEDRRITYLYLEENIGFGRANNAGLEHASGRNILFLNSDTLLRNNAVKILSDFLDTHPDTGVAGGNLFNADMKPGMSFQRLRPSLAWELNQMLFNVPARLRYGKTGTYFNTGSEPSEVGYVMGADMMVRKKTLEETGSFDPRFFMYFEETDLCARISESGRKIVSVPGAEIVHLEGKSVGKACTDKVNTRRIEMFERSRLTYYSKHFSRISNHILNAVYTFGLRLDSLIFTMTGRGYKKKVAEARLAAVRTLKKGMP